MQHVSLESISTELSKDVDVMDGVDAEAKRGIMRHYYLMYFTYSIEHVSTEEGKS